MAQGNFFLNTPDYSSDDREDSHESMEVSLENAKKIYNDQRIREEQTYLRNQRIREEAHEASRLALGSITDPLKRKHLESYYTVQQKKDLLQGNVVKKQYGKDGFKEYTVEDLDDGDSGVLVDENGKRYEFRSFSGGSLRYDAPDYFSDVNASPYKSSIQPEAIARASGKSVRELTDWDYQNYEAYAQVEAVRRLAAQGDYYSEKYDPTKTYTKMSARGMKVFARMEGKDIYDRYLANIQNAQTGADFGYDSALDPNVNANFSLFNSLNTAANDRKVRAAIKAGEIFREREATGELDPYRQLEETRQLGLYRERSDNPALAVLKQGGASALQMTGNIAYALHDTLGGRDVPLHERNALERLANKDVAQSLVGMSVNRRNSYDKYISDVSEQFESGNIIDGLAKFVSRPDLMTMFVAEQLGNMAPGIAATVATGGAGATSFGAATATDLLANIGMDFMEFRKNHGRSMNASEMAKAYVRQLPAAILDALSDKILVGNSNVFKTARYTPLRAAGEVAKEMGVEGTQEVVQNIASQMNAEDKSFAEAATDPSNISNFMLGALGGGLMSGPVGGGQAVRHYIKQANYERIRQQYGEDYDKTTYHDGDTLREDHKAVRENLISSTRDSFDKAKESVDVNGMISNIGTLNNEIKNTQSGLSKRDVDHMRSSLYDMISDMVATSAANGILSEDLNNVLQQLQDSLGVENNEQLKKELARYAEVYGSAAVGDKEGKTDDVFSRRNLASSDYYENASDVESRAQRFEDLIQNLGGTKAEARKLLEEVAEENINDKNEGFNSSLAKAKEAQEKGDTETYNNEVDHMTGRLQSMVMKMQEITDGLRSNMNKGATTDSRGFLSDDKFTILYGNEKDSSRRGEKAQFRTSFKKEAFNYSTRGGLFRTTDQIASEARYMAEQLNSLDISDEQKSAIKQQLDLLQEYENDINHMGYELHRGIRGGFNYEADTDGEAVLSEGEKAKIKGAMEDYFHQYVTPNTGEKSLSQKEAVDLKKYVNTLSLGQLKAFQKSLDPKEDSIAYEGVSSVIKARESARGVATSHAQWRGTHYQNGKYIRSLVQTTQTTEKGNEAKIDNMVNGTHVDAINNSNILEAHHEQLQQRIAKLEVKKNRTKREEKKLNDLKARLKSTKERLGTLEKISDAGAKTIYRQYASKILDHPAQLSNLIAKVYKANIEQDAKVNVRAYEKAIKMLRDTLHDAASMETDKTKLKEAKKALEILNNVLKRAKKSTNALEGRDTTINNLINICSKENLRKLSDIDFLKALKQSMEKFKTMLGDRLDAYKGPYKEALYNLAYKIRLIERNDEDLARSILYDIKHNGDLNDLKARAAQYEKKIAELQSKKSLSADGQKMLDRYKQYSSAIAKQAKKLEDRANEFENKLPDRPDIFAVDSIDELENIDRTLVNSLSQLYDPKSEFYGNKLAVQKVMEIRKDIRDRIAELSEKQDTSESPQNGSESTETGQGEQSTTETQESSQNGSEGSETASEKDASASKSLEDLKIKYSTALDKAGLEKEQVNAVVEVLINNAKILADAFGMSVEDYLNTRFAGFQSMSQKEFEEKYSNALYQSGGFAEVTYDGKPLRDLVSDNDFYNDIADKLVNQANRASNGKDLIERSLKKITNNNSHLQREVDGTNTVLEYIDNHKDINKDNVEDLEDSDLYNESTGRAIGVLIESILFEDSSLEEAKQRIIEDTEATKQILSNSKRTYDFIKNLDPDKLIIRRLDSFSQKKRGQEAKGATTISANQSLITLFEKGDVSTALHETSHFFLNEVRELIKSGKAPKWMQSVWSTLQNQYGFDGLLDGTDSKSVKSWTRVQERFARDFEAYMREGKAPKPELQSIFDACKKWLKAIYKTIRSLLGKNKLSPEIRQAFDALFTGEFKGDENAATESEIDNSDVYTLEQNLQQFLDTYQEIDESLLPEDIRSILAEISDRMDEVSKYANDPAISKYYGTLQKLYHDYDQLLKEAVTNDNSSVSSTSTSTSIDVDLPELSSDLKEAAIETQIQEVIKRYWNLDPDQPSGYFAKAIDELLDAYGLTAKLSAEKFSIYNELYIQLSDQYNAAFYDALDREAEAKRNKRDKIENIPKEEETTEQLRKRLIVGGTEETDEADSEAEQERKYHQLHFPKHITSRWSQKALNGAFKDIKNIRNIFGAKESSMTLYGLPDSIIPDNWRDYQDDPESPLYRDAPLGKLVALAVDSLSKILVTYHFSKDTPLTRWDSKKKKYVPITELNGILNNVLRNAPHVQLLYQPDLSTMEIGRNYKGFKSSYIMDAMINPNTAVAIILGVAELFANRSVSSIFNPKTNEEIASAFGMNPDNIDPMDLQVFTKVANKYGVFKKNISTTLGHLIMDNLGLKRGNKLEEESYTIYDNSVAALGNVGLLLAEELGFITSTRVYTGEFPTAPSSTASQQEKDAFQREVSKYLKSRHLDELDITPEQAVHLGLGQSNVRYFYKYNESQETDNAVKELWLGPVVDTADKGEYLGDSAPVYTREEEFGAKSFKTGRDTLTRTPLLNAKDVHNSPTRRKQPNFRLTENRMRVLNEESKAPYYINTPILDEILKTCDGNETKMRKLLLTRMGWDSRIEDDDFDNLSYDEKTKIKGKNENLERELDAFLDYARLQKDLESEGKFFGYFFRYFGSANGRSFMDTNTLNPQTSKAFPRFLCQPETTYQEYNLNDANDIQCELFAVAQAFDCLKSYYSSKENESRNGVSLAGRLLGLDVVNGDIADIQKRLETLRGIQRDLILNDSDTNADKYGKIGWNGGFENFGQAVVAIDHCVRRLEAILAKGGKTEGATISSYLSVENDSTTSGYVIKFLLMPLDKDLLAEYGLKVGYLNHALIQNNPNFSDTFKERIKSYTSIDQLKADPEFLDIYKTGAVEMVNEYEDMKKEAEKRQETLGEVAFNSLCTVESNDKEDDTRELNSFGKKVDNAGIDAVDVDHAIKTVEAAIPHPEKDSKTGLWKVSSVLRNLMKPIIMIFGYNASNESCEKRFGEAVMDEHIKIFVNLYNKQGIYGSKGKVMLAPIAYELYKGKRSKEEIDAIFNFMTDIAQRVTGYKNQKSAIDKLVKALRAKSPYAIKFKPIARDQAGVYNTISVAEWYKLVVGGTFGKAVTKFLDKKFGAYGKANRHLNNASKITFKLYSHVRNALIKQRLAKLIEQDGNPNASDAAKSRIKSLKKKYAPQVAKNDGKLSVNFMGISDLKTREVRVIDNICRPLLPVFQMPETDADKVNPKTGAVVSTNIRSVDTASADLSNSSAATPIKSKDIDGNSMPEYVPRSDNEADGYKFENDTLNSYGDITEFSSGDRMLAVLLIHFVDGVLAEHTMDHMLQLKKYLTVIHDAFVLSAKDGKFLDQGFNEALAKVCEYFNPFEIVAIALNQMKKVSLEICEKNSIPDFDFIAPLNPKRFGSKLFNPTYGQVQHEIIELSKLVRAVKREIFNSNDQIILANLGGDTGGQYTIAGAAKVPGVGNEMSTPTIQEKAQIEPSALGSKASAWKDRYDIDSIEQEANSSKEGRAKMFNALNEYDKAYGMVENSEEYLNDVQSLLNEINPERFTNLPLETATSKTGTAGKGVYFTGANGGQRRITIIKPSAISSAADQRSRFVSRQTSMAAVYAHELIHPAVGEAIANPDAYGVTREVDILKQFHNDVGKELTPEFFRPSDYDTYTEAEKKLADQSAQETYDYMFNNPDKDTIGGLQEFVAWAVTDPRMREYLKNRQASSYSKEYNGKNTLQKIMYILKHIFKAMFGNKESRDKVMATLTRVGTESRKQTNTLDAMQKLIVEISHANRYAANKLNNNKLSKLENVFEALGSAMQVIKPVNDFVSDKVKWIFDLGGVSNRFERTYKSLEEIIRAQGITENGSKMDTLKTLLLCPFSHNMRVALTDTLIGCCSLGQRSTFAHLIRDISDKDDATRQLETLASNRTNIDRMSRGVGAAYSAEILEAFEGKLSEEDSIALTKAGIGCDLQSLLTNGYTVKEIQELASGIGIEEAIKSHEMAIAKHYEKAKNGKKMATWTRNQCIGLAHFMNTNKGNPSQCLNAYDIARGFLSSSINDKADEKLIGHIDCLASLYAIWNARPEDRLAISKMNAKGLETTLKCHRDLVSKSFDAGYIERTHMIKGWHSSIIDDTKAYAVAPVDPATRKQMEEDGYKLYNDQALPVDGMTNAILGFYVKDMITPEHRQGAALQITGKRSMGQSLNSFMENNPDIIGDRRDYITKQIKKAHAIRMRMQNTMETEEDLSYEDFTNRGIVGSYYTPIINPKGQVVDFRITMFNDFKDEAMKRDNNVLSVISKMGMTHAVKASAGDQNLNIVHFLVDDMEKNMDPNTHTVRRQYENLGEVILGSQERRNKHDIKYIRLQIDPDSEFIAPDIPAAIVPSEMREAMRKLEKHGDGLWVREDWLYQIFGTPEMSMADMEVFKKENMRAVRNGIRFAEHLIKAIATLAKVAIVFKKPAVIIGNAVSNYLFHLMNGQNPVTAARMDTENLQLIMEYMKMEKDINRLDLKKDIGEATPAEKAQLTRLRAHLEHSPIHELVQAGLFSAVVEDTSKKDQDAIKVMLRKITENEQLKKTAKSIVGDVFDMDTKIGQAAGQLYMREGTPIYDFIYTMTQYSDFVSRATDYRIGMRNMPEKIRNNADLRRKYKKALIEQIRDDYINYDIPQSKLMNYVNAMGYTFFTKYFFRIQRIIRRTTTRRPLMSFAMIAANSRFDMPDNIFEQAPWHKNYGAIMHTPWGNVEDLLPPPLLNLFGFFG